MLLIVCCLSSALGETAVFYGETHQKRKVTFWTGKNTYRVLLSIIADLKGYLTWFWSNSHSTSPTCHPLRWHLDSKITTELHIRRMFLHGWHQHKYASIECCFKAQKLCIWHLSTTSLTISPPKLAPPVFQVDWIMKMIGTIKLHFLPLLTQSR